MGMDDKLGGGSKALGLLAAAVVVLIGLKLAAPIVVPLLLAVFIAAATSPVVRWLTRRGLPTGASVLLVIVAVLGVLFALGFVITSALVDLNDAMPEYFAAATEAKRDAAAWLAGHGMGRAARSLAAFDLGAWLSDMTTATIVNSAPNLVSSFVVVFLVVAFILLESATFRTKVSWAKQAGGANLAHLAGTVHEIQKYLAVKSGISLATGILCGLWCWAWGVEHALLWGLVAFVLNYIPNVGSAAAAVPPILVALAHQGLGPASAVLVGYIVINMTLGNVLEPKLMGRALGLSPLVVVVSMIVWGYVLGPIGAVLSAPLTMVLKIVMAHTGDLRWVAVLLAPPRTDEWHARSSGVPAPPPPELRHSMHPPQGALHDAE